MNNNNNTALAEQVGAAVGLAVTQALMGAEGFGEEETAWAEDVQKQISTLDRKIDDIGENMDVDDACRDWMSNNFDPEDHDLLTSSEVEQKCEEYGGLTAEQVDERIEEKVDELLADKLSNLQVVVGEGVE